MTIIAILLGLAFLVAAFHIYRLKRDLAIIYKKLHIIGGQTTNMRLTTRTYDKDIRNLEIGLNEILDKYQQLLIESERASLSFRSGITNVSHDLRTPLTSALGYIQLLKSSNLSAEKHAEYVAVVESRLESLTTLMGELFDYTKVIEGKVIYQMETLDVSHLLQETILSFYEDFVQAHFEVDLKFPDTPLEVIGDKASIVRIFQNLIKNVLCHGQEFFQLEIIGNQIFFRNKIAYPESLEIDRLFERFYTSDMSRISKRTGLGLAITQELLVQMGGMISAKFQGGLIELQVTFKERVGEHGKNFNR
ncbi:MAG: HAMP domain-containing histidine kinase [Turicibacter sp.]|nr:HAMP domain-containing histidine kinase [Turicibacter sp.]